MPLDIAMEDDHTLFKQGIEAIIRSVAYLSKNSNPDVIIKTIRECSDAVRR